MATLTLQQAQAALATQQAKLDAANAALAKATASKAPAAQLKALQTNVATAKQGVTAAQTQLAPLQQQTQPTPTVDPRIAVVNGMLGPNGQAFGAVSPNSLSPVTQGTGANAITFYPTPTGWVQTQVPGAQGYVAQTALPNLQQQQVAANAAYQKQQADIAAKAAADAKAKADAAAAKKAADAAAVAAAQKAAQEAAAQKVALAEKFTNDISTATTRAQVDSYVNQAVKAGITLNNDIIANAKAKALQSETNVFNNSLDKATTADQINSLVTTAKNQGITLDPAKSLQRVDLTRQLSTATNQANINNIVETAKNAGITLDQTVIDKANERFTVPKADYIDVSTIDPKVLADYGVKTTTVDGKSVIQTTNTQALGYVNPSELQKYQQLTAKNYAAQQAQANFKLPDPTTAGRGETVTSPNGQDFYQAAGNQWYKVSADGKTYTPVNESGQATGQAAIDRVNYFNQYDTAQQAAQTKQYNDYVASIPTVTIEGKQYQSQDPTAPNYINAQDLEFTKQQAVQRVNDYNAQLANVVTDPQLLEQLKQPTPDFTPKTAAQAQAPSVAQPVSGSTVPSQAATAQQPVSGPVAPSQAATAQPTAQQPVISDQLKSIVTTSQMMVDPKTGTIYQSMLPSAPNYVAPGAGWWQKAEEIGAAPSNFSLNSWQEKQAANQTLATNNAFKAYQSTFENSKQGDPQPVMSAKDLPDIGGGTKPRIAADTGITYYPTAGGWKQASNPDAADYQTANQIQMKLPEPQYQEGMDIYYSNVRGPDGTMYTPKWANPNTGEAGGYMQSSNPSAPGYVDQQTFDKISQQQITAGYAGTSYTNIDPVTGRQITTTNPYAANYMSQEQYMSNLNQIRAQEAAEREIFGIDDLGRSIDDFVNKTVGWETIATIAGSALGGPLGAALANATVGAVQGKTPGEILKSAALTYALAYGTQALANELGPALQDATNTAVDSGMLDPEVLGQAADDFAGAGYGDYMPDIVENYGTATPVQPDFGVADDFFGPVQPDSIYDIADDSFTSDFGNAVDDAFGSVDDAFGTSPVAPEIPDSIYDIADDFGNPVQPQVPTDLPSTGFSDSAPGTIYNGPNGPEIVLDSGKTVSLADYNAAVEAGGPVSIDGMLQTGGSGVPSAGGAYTVEISGAPYVEGTAPGGFTAPEGMRLANIDEAMALSNAGGTATTLPNGSMAWIVPEGTLPEIVVTATREGILTPEMIMGGAAVVGGAVALGMGAGGSAAPAVPAATPAPTPVEPVPTPTPTPTPVEPVPVEPTPTPTPVEPTPVPPTEPVPGPTPTPAPVEPVPGPTTPAPVEPGPVTPTPTTPGEVPVTDITPTPVEPVTPPAPPEVPPGEVPVTDVTPAPVEPTPVEPTPPTPTEPVPTNPNEVPVIDKSTPYTGEYSNESVLERYLNKTITYGDVLTLVGAGMVAPTILGMLGVTPEQPTQPGYGPIPPTKWGTVPGLAVGGVNPGYFTNPQPFYKTTSPVQSKFYWGAHPYIQNPEDMANLNNIPNAPAQPWGRQQAMEPFDVNAFITRQGLTPQPTSGIPGYNNAPFTAYQTPQPVPVVNTGIYTQPVAPIQPVLPNGQTAITTPL